MFRVIPERWEVAWVVACIVVGCMLRSPETPVRLVPMSATTTSEVKTTSQRQTHLTPAQDSAVFVTESSAAASVQTRGLYDRATRRARVRVALPDLFQLAPAPDGYLSTLRNPCWKGRYRKNDGKGMPENHSSLLCVPGFYIIGHVKGGTSDLWQFISKHPNVNLGRVLKEQHYFSRPWITADQFVSRYRRFSNAVGGGNRTDMESIAGDATPDLIWANLRTLNVPFHGKSNVSIAEVLAELHPEARLVLTLREPTARLWSDFFYFAHRPNSERDLEIPHPDTNVTELDFDRYANLAVSQMRACIEGATTRDCAFRLRNHRRMHASNVRFAMGCYGPFVEEYLANFRRDQLLIVTLEEYRTAPKETLQSVFRHLGVHEPTELEWRFILGRRKVTNQQGDHYKKLKMLPSTRLSLKQAYAPCIEHLDRVYSSTDRFSKLWGFL